MKKNEKESAKRREMVETYLKYNSCPVAATIGIIGGKWKPIILYVISHDVSRFGEMLKSIDGISKKMLAVQLRELENDGMINRKVFAEVPPRVEYTMSDKSLALVPAIIMLREWGLKNVLTPNNSSSGRQPRRVV